MVFILNNGICLKPIGFTLKKFFNQEEYSISHRTENPKWGIKYVNGDGAF